MSKNKPPEDSGREEAGSEENSGESTESKSRRDLLKGLATGSAVVAGQEVLPDKWSKPLMDTIALPAHAITTRPDDDESGNPDGSSDNPLADDFRDEGEDADNGTSDPADPGTDDIGDGNDDAGANDSPDNN